jgi:membrane protein DedA with SNARE-associated domain
VTLEHLISQYGYMALVVGTFFEGETILVAAGFAAHLGDLKGGPRQEVGLIQLN